MSENWLLRTIQIADPGADRRRLSALPGRIGALVAVLALAAPEWASTVQIQDDAHVLNATVVQNEA
ncbi:MAG: hypothetical protein ACRDS0_28035 [Pseudonocardiaceae bacterium]